MGVFDTLSVGRRALGAASAGIDVTAQNVANAGTVGYSRRRLLTQTADPIQKKGVWVGQGVDVSGIARASDLLLGARVVGAAGAQKQAEAMEQALSVAEAYFDETGATGLSEAYGAFFDALSSLTQDPSDLSLRRETVNAASTLANAVSRTGQGLQSSIESADGSLNQHMETVNAQLREIAQLNAAIGRSGASLGAGDLLDRRDQLVRELGEDVGATVEFHADGQATVFVGGHAAVSGGASRTLSVLEDSTGAAQVHLSAGSGTIRVTDEVGGEVGGLLAARTEMQDWLGALDDFATAMADAVNAQHAAGYDATGAAGGDVFTWDPGAPAASLAVDAALLDDASGLALAGAPGAMPGDDTNLRALLQLEEDALYAAGTRTGAEQLSAIVGAVGSAVSGAAADAEALSTQLSDLEAMKDAISRVDTDEEAIRLVEYQAQYRAAAKVLSVGDELLQTLMQIGA